MPCVDCERNPRLRATVICPDPWREGAAAGQSSGGRMKSENKLLSSKARYKAGGGLGTSQKCIVCKKKLDDFCTKIALDFYVGNRFLLP